jgi:hypothetical protein
VSGTVKSLGLLVEEQRTNLLLRSEDFMNVWTLFQSSRIENTSIAPDNQLTADSLIPDVGATNGLIRQNISGLLDNTTYTFSVFLKFAGLSNISLQFFNKSGTFHGSKVLNLSNGLLSGTGFIGETSVVSYPNDWYRLIFTNLGSGAGAETPNVRVVCLSTGDGTSGLFLWGAQLEQASYPTSYIPTAASTVTRTADNASMTGENFSSWYNQTEGTVYIRSYANNPSGTMFSIESGNSSVNNSILLGATPSNLTFRVRGESASTQASFTLTSAGEFSFFKNYIGTYSTNSFNASVNGVISGSDDVDGIPPNIQNNLKIGYNASPNTNINGHIAQLSYYPSRLPNQVLQTLTK